MIKFSFDPHCQIIRIGSTFSSIGYPGYVSYSASKFALPGATEALAREYVNRTGFVGDFFI
ncbi:hypothetical protein VH96_05545 [Acinetobacter indicus]|nr:hypothetical protein VH96_05545 [Acinetobacter indicus]